MDVSRVSISQLNAFATRLWHKIPLTFTGAIAIPLLAWLMTTIGFSRQDRVVLSIAALGLVWIGMAMVMVTLAAVCLWLRSPKGHTESISLTANEPMSTGFAVSRFPWGLVLQIRIEWINPSGVDITLEPQGNQLLEQATASHRTLVSGITRRLHISDPFGMAAVAVNVVSSQRLIILPNLGDETVVPPALIDNLTDAIPHPNGAPEGDLAEFRPYGAGDPLKRILWKTYARTRQVIVRNPEKANSPTSKLHFYFVAGDGDEASASVARGLLERAALGEFLFGADGSESPATTVFEGLECLARSEQNRDRGAEGLEHFLRTTTAGRSGCVLFLPAFSGCWIDRVTSLLAGASVQCQVIIGTDGITEQCPSIASRLLWNCRSASAQANHVRQIRDRVVATGAAVHIVDRRTGENLELV